MKKLIALIAIIVAVVAVYANREGINHFFEPDKKETPPPDPKKQILREMLVLNNLFDSAGGDYHLKGKFTVIDFADRANAMKDLPYIIEKSADQLYMRMGSVEMLNSDLANIQVNHNNKDIVLSRPRPVEVPTGLTSEQLLQMVEIEKYEVRKTVSGGLVAFSLVNEKHTICKEYTIKATTDKKIVEVFTRYADTEEPANTSKEKTTTLQIENYGSGLSSPELLSMNRMIDTSAGSVQPVAALKNYSVIKM